MKKYKKLSFIFALLIALLPCTGHASYWLECKVKASLVEDLGHGEYIVKIIAASALASHEKEGAPCLEDRINTDITIQSVTALPNEEVFDLKYSYYQGMTPNGVASSESWSIF